VISRNSSIAVFRVWLEGQRHGGGREQRGPEAAGADADGEPELPHR
jgi:hypothetical protein